MQKENCRKVESVNNREDKHQLLVRKSPGFQYVCHLNILRYLHQRSHRNVLEISLKEIWMVTNVSGLLTVVRNDGDVIFASSKH